MEYDIIGDIHGQADKLEVLLSTMGYVNSGGRYRHPTRTAVFVGDFVDRGRAQLRTVDIVRRMVDSGSALAVMGNHELNAIAWHTPHPTTAGEFLRPHEGTRRGDNNRKQHASFLAEVENDPVKHREIVDWFLTLPLWLELGGLRIVHACWHGRFMEMLAPRLNQGKYLTRELMVEATNEPEDELEKDNPEFSVFKAVEALTKGIEVTLPHGKSFLDKGGHRRYRARVRWWDETASTYDSAVMLQSPVDGALPSLPIPEYARLGPPGKIPVFFGHYWLTEEPSVMGQAAACVDYSAGNGGPLVAYQWRGEALLDSRQFVWAP